MSYNSYIFPTFLIFEIEILIKKIPVPIMGFIFMFSFLTLVLVCLFLSFGLVSYISSNQSIKFSSF